MSSSATASGSLSKESRVFRFEDRDNPFVLASGDDFHAFELAYETYGTLSPGKDNAILLFHALTGSQNAAGFTESVPAAGGRWTDECQTGWWDGFIGPGKALDTDRFFVICVNYLGGCYGSTGPSSIDPETGRPWGSDFPRLTMSDIVDSQVRLLDELGIGRLHATVGASIGGMLVLNLATRFPERVRIAVPIATGMQTSAIQKLHNFEQILAIETDPNFRSGDYYGGPSPDYGLALARIISHKTFIHINQLASRARDEIKQPEDALSWYRLSRHLESYMLHQGRKFVKRFDANTYLRIVDAWQQFDLLAATGARSFDSLFQRCRDQHFLVFSIDSDVCFYPEDQSDLKAALDACGVSSMHITVHSEKGHDSFLLEPELYTPHIAYTLANA